MEKNIPDRYRYQMNSDISPYEAWNEQRKKLQKRIQNQYDFLLHAFFLWDCTSMS